MPTPPPMGAATRRRDALLAGLGGAAFAAAGGPPRRAGAQPAAGRPVTVVVPYAAGGGTDITAREFAQILAGELNQTVVVDNRGGAAGHVGWVGVGRARPDGATLLFGVSTNIVVNPNLQRGGDRVNLAAALVPLAQVSSYQQGSRMRSPW